MKSASAIAHVLGMLGNFFGRLAAVIVGVGLMVVGLALGVAYEGLTMSINGSEGALNAWRLATAAIIVVSAAPLTAGAREPPQPYSGSGDYLAYCASCHGAEARGDGVIAKSLKKRPADLTQLARRNNGVFPEERVVTTIDGREPGTAHGGSDMPAWGGVLAGSRDSAGAENAAVRIGVLVKYLETLQAK
jgi:mono/diheme cytochrome c family protein